MSDRGLRLPFNRETFIGDEGDEDDDAGNRSFDSYNVSVTKKFTEPDFILVMIDADPQGIQDTPLLCIEVKTKLDNKEAKTVATSQFKDYLQHLASKNPHCEFCGILLGGDRYFTGLLTWNKDNEFMGVRMGDTNDGQGCKPSVDLVNYLEHRKKLFLK